MKKAVSVIVALIFMFNGTLHLASALEDDISLERYTDLITKYYEASIIRTMIAIWIL